MSWDIDPILIDLPDSFESERLIMRWAQPGDGPATYEAIVESMENLRPWMPWARLDSTLEDTKISLRRSAARFQTREDLRINIWRKEDSLFVGGSGLHRIDWSVPRFEIGYWVRASLEGQGYITEAVRRITGFAFEDLRAERVEIRCDLLNERSVAVAHRAGYTQEGHLRHDSRSVSGELRDTLIFGILRADWAASRK